MDYKIFQKTITGKDGKTKKRWYCYYTDEYGIRRQKVCKDCKTRADATEFVSKLTPVSKKAGRKIKWIAKNMFLSGSQHIKRLEATGKTLTLMTIKQSRHYLEQIIEKWGEHDISDLKVAEVGNYLIGLDRSGSWKKHYITTLYEVYNEAAWQGLEVTKPIFPHFACRPTESSVFSSQELKTFFDVTNFEGSKADSETLYLFFLVSVVAGLRLGETRALRPRQFIFDKNALIIDGFIREDGTRTDFNKKGSQSDKKTRIVLIPDDVNQKIKDYISKHNKDLEDFLFTFNKKPLSVDILHRAFKNALKNAGIDTENRKLTPHSLRYTYVTKMRRSLPIDIVRKLVGHTEDKMTDYYTKSTLEDGLAGISGTKEAVESLFE